MRGWCATHGIGDNVKSKTKLPQGPRLASSNCCKSIALRLFLNHVHLSWPMQASVGTLVRKHPSVTPVTVQVAETTTNTKSTYNNADCATCARIAITVLIWMASGQLSTVVLSLFASVVIIPAIKSAPTAQRNTSHFHAEISLYFPLP